MNEKVAPYYRDNRHLRQPSFYVKCLHVLVLPDTKRHFSGDTFIYVTPPIPVFRFVTSIVLGMAYDRRIIDLDDEMVSFKH